MQKERRILITTQAMDIDDPILGFFHGWVREFSNHFDQIDVICLREGKHNLPSHVHIHSLGKEGGENRLKYIVRFFRILLELNTTYSVVFSHMNPHYIVLAGWLWKLCGVRILFWRNHAKMNLMTRVAAYYAERIFYTSPYACTRIFKNSMQMPVGIDTKLFVQRPGIERIQRSVLFLGRLSAVKRPELFAAACSFMEGVTVSVYGDSDRNGSVTTHALQELAHSKLTFHPAIPNYQTPEAYSAHEVYVNLTPEGSMDKTILEAAACGALILVSNRSFEGFVPELCILDRETPEAIAERVQRLLELPPTIKEEYRAQLRKMVVEHHSLESLTKKLITTVNATAQTT